MGFDANAEQNQRLSQLTVRLLTSFSTVCVKKSGHCSGRHAQKTGADIFLLRIRCLGWRSCACAQFCPQKMCRKPGWADGVVVLNPAYFLDLEISLSKIKYLPIGKLISHKFIHRNCGQLHATPRRRRARSPPWTPVPDAAKFLRTEKYPLRIKVLGATTTSCAHFYPQKV